MLTKKTTSSFSEISNSALYEFSNPYHEKKTKRADTLDGKTIRALSIDLGLKQFGAAAVGQIIYDKNIIGSQEYNIERMFMLRLDGEKHSSSIEKERIFAQYKIQELRTKIRYLSFIKRIYNLEDTDKRKKLLASAVEHTQNTDKLSVMNYCLETNNKEQIDECLKKEYDRLISEMNIEMKEFRLGEICGKQKRRYAPGKTFWSISYLEELRKLIISWNTLGYHIDDNNKQMNIKYGVTATKLLEHINNLKDDRIKTGADLIIQSALGYVYDVVA